MTESQNRQHRRDETARLLEEVFGPRWRQRAAPVLGYDAAAFRRLFTPPKGRQDAPPLAVLAVAELLYELEPHRWPDRWKQDTEQAP